MAQTWDRALAIISSKFPGIHETDGWFGLLLSAYRMVNQTRRRLWGWSSGYHWLDSTYQGILSLAIEFFAHLLYGSGFGYNVPGSSSTTPPIYCSVVSRYFGYMPLVIPLAPTPLCSLPPGCSRCSLLLLPGLGLVTSMERPCSLLTVAFDNAIS